MFRPTIANLKKESKKELLREFHQAIEEEKRKLEYLKEAVEFVHKKESHHISKLFLKDALAKLDKTNDRRLDLQEALIITDENEIEY